MRGKIGDFIKGVFAVFQGMQQVYTYPNILPELDSFRRNFLLSFVEKLLCVVHPLLISMP